MIHLNIVLCEILPKTMHPFKMLSFLMEIIFNDSCREVLLVSEVYCTKLFFFHEHMGYCILKCIIDCNLNFLPLHKKTSWIKCG